MSKTPERIPEGKIVTHLTDGTAHIIEIEFALQKIDPKIIGAARYKLIMDRKTQVTRHKDVEANLTKSSNTIERARLDCHMITQRTTTGL